MSPKQAAVNALRFVYKFGMASTGSDTSGLVRLADGNVEYQVIAWDRRGKHIRARTPVTKEELAKYGTVGFLEDHMSILPETRNRSLAVIFDDLLMQLEMERD